MLAARGETNNEGDAAQDKLHFAKWDVNHNNALSRYEVDLAAANHIAPEKERAIAASLGRAMRTKGLKSLIIDQLKANLEK